MDQGGSVLTCCPLGSVDAAITDVTVGLILIFVARLIGMDGFDQPVLKSA